MIVPPGFSSPFASASSIIFSPIRSFTLPPGCYFSRVSSPRQGTPAMIFGSLTRGVFPIVSRMLSKYRIPRPTPSPTFDEKDGRYKNVRGSYNGQCRLNADLSSYGPKSCEADSEWTAGLRLRGCRGRESNPLETDLQSVTLAALSPRRRSPNRRAVIETLETHSRALAGGTRATGNWNAIGAFLRGVLASPQSSCRVRASSDKLLESTPPFYEFRPGGELYGARGGRGGRTRRCSAGRRGSSPPALGPHHCGPGRRAGDDHGSRHRGSTAQPPAVDHRRGCQQRRGDRGHPSRTSDLLGSRDRPRRRRADIFLELRRRADGIGHPTDPRLWRTRLVHRRLDRERWKRRGRNER